MNILDKAIETEGSVTALAKTLGVVVHAISNWRNRGIPRAWEMLLIERYGHQQRPEKAVA